MNTYVLALQLMGVQGVLGAFDTLYHHELTETLAQRSSAMRELAIHAARALFYCLLFIGLSAWEWHGAWAWLLLAIFAVEIALTLWDFVVEDRSRLLPVSERITHTVLAINGGAFVALLALNMYGWAQQPTAVLGQTHGILSIFLFLCGIGVGVSGIRDALAARHLARAAREDRQLPPIHFSDAPQSVLVTGGTGFVGSRLIKALLANGQRVTLLSRDPRKAAWMFDGQVRCVGSMRDLSPDDAIDVVINLAGARILGWRWSSKRKAALLVSRVQTTRALVDWISTAKRKPKLLLSASAIGYYGIQAPGDDTLLTENAPPQPIFMSQLCQEWEAVAQSAGRYGVTVACLRFGVVFGRQGALPMMLLPIKLGVGGPLGSGKQWLSWIHVHDVLRGIAHVWQRQVQGGGAGSYNFTAPAPLMQKQFSQIAAKVAMRPAFMPTPAFAMRLLLGEQADLLLEGQRVIPSRLLAEGFQFSYPEVLGALRSLK